jgi:hypothetical protein
MSGKIFVLWIVTLCGLVGGVTGFWRCYVIPKIAVQPVYIAKPVPHSKHFNSENGGSVYLWNVGILLLLSVVTEDDHKPKASHRPLLIELCCIP